jgi:hypothetical protein
MFIECECGENCPICEGCDFPLCECKCDEFQDIEDDDENDLNW